MCRRSLVVLKTENQVPKKQPTPKKQRAVSPRPPAPNTQGEEDQARLTRLLNILAQRPHPIIRKVSERELREILSHFSLNDIWRHIRGIKRDSKPKSGTQHNPWLARDKEWLVWRYTIPLSKFPGQITTGVKAIPPLGREKIDPWIASLPPAKRALVIAAKFKAMEEQSQEEQRAYILWNATIATLLAYALISDSAHFVGAAAGSNILEPTPIIDDWREVLLPFYEAVGIDVDKIMAVSQFANDFSKPREAEFFESPEHYI